MQRIDVQKSDEMPSEKTRAQLCANFIREIVLKFTKKLTHTHTNFKPPRQDFYLKHFQT